MGVTPCAGYLTRPHTFDSEFLSNSPFSASADTLSSQHRVDKRRAKIRVGHKKDEAIMLTAEQARLLKTQHASTPQGIRDRLVMSLLLDLGLRASEVAELRVEDFAESGHVTVRRPKTDSADRMELSADILKALVAYAPYQPKEGLLLRGSRKSEELTDQNMSVRAIGSRTKTLGRDILGIWELSPHDLRHTWGRPFGRLVNASKDATRDQKRVSSPWRSSRPSPVESVSFQGT